MSHYATELSATERNIKIKYIQNFYMEEYALSECTLSEYLYIDIKMSLLALWDGLKYC